MAPCSDLIIFVTLVSFEMNIAALNAEERRALIRCLVRVEQKEIIKDAEEINSFCESIDVMNSVATGAAEKDCLES